MKLNLLPTTVSKGKQAKSAIVFSALIAIAGAGVAIFVATSSEAALAKAKEDQAASVGPAQKAYNESIKADAIMNAPSSVALIRDATLATEMINHNDVYPNLYDSVQPYIPSFFRINSESAVAGSKDVSTVTLVGTVKTYQQYADLMLAFSRYPGLVSIGRAGYQDDSDIVPNLTPADQTGNPRKPNDSPVPDDKLARLTYFESQVQPQGYTGQGNFGSGTDNTRGAMPGYSLVTVTLTIAKDLTVVQPRTSLASTGGSGGSATGGGAGSTTPANGGRTASGAGAGNTAGTTPKKGGKKDSEDNAD
jgi:hypothetical protein